MATRISNDGWPETECDSEYDYFDEWFDDDDIPPCYDPGQHTFLFGAGSDVDNLDDYVRRYNRINSIQFLKSMIRKIELSFKEIIFRPNDEIIEQNNFSHHLFVPLTHVTADFAKNTFILMLTASYIRLNEMTNNESRKVVERNVKDRIEMMKTQVIKRTSERCEGGVCETHASSNDSNENFSSGIVGNHYAWFPNGIIPVCYEPTKHCFLFEVDADLDYFMSLYEDIESISFLESMIATIEKAYKEICLCPDNEQLCDIDYFGYINICAHKIKDAFTDMLTAVHYQLNALTSQKQPKNKVVKKIKNRIKVLIAEAAKENQTKLNEPNDLNENTTSNSEIPIKTTKKKKKKKKANNSSEIDGNRPSSSNASLSESQSDSLEKYQTSLEKFNEILKSSAEKLKVGDNESTFKNLAGGSNPIKTSSEKKKANTINIKAEKCDSPSSNNVPSLSESHSSLTKENYQSNLNKENEGLLHKSAVEEIVEGIMSTLRNKALASLSELNQKLNNINSDTSGKNKIPIFFYCGDGINTISIMKEINSFTAHETYGTSCRKGLMLNPTSNSDYELISKYLSNKGIPYHTYAKKDELPCKFVFRGLPSFIEEAEILQELKKLGYSPIKIIQLRQKDHVPMPLVLVIMPSDKESENILKVTKFLGFKIKVEKKHKKKRNMPVMCYKCQEIGHTSYKCFRDDVCVRCGENHRSADCKRPVNEKPTCVHCKMNHTANFKGCSNYLNYLKKFTEKREKASASDQSVTSFAF